MDKNSDPDIRRQIAELIERNSDSIAKSLNDLWHRFAQDMISGGVPHTDVAESMMTVGISHGLLTLGPEGIIGHLRDIADLYERTLVNETAQRSVRH